MTPEQLESMIWMEWEALSSDEQKRSIATSLPKKQSSAHSAAVKPNRQSRSHENQVRDALSSYV